MRRHRNRTVQVQDDNGIMQSRLSSIEYVMVSYLSNLFSAKSTLAIYLVLNYVQPRVTDMINEQLCLPYTKVEIEQALSNMHPHKAPSPDSFNAFFFFQKYWDIVGEDMCAAILVVLNGPSIPPKLNHSFMALIPKKPNALSMSDFRSISLCNVIYIN